MPTVADPVEAYWTYAQTQDLDPGPAVNMVNSTLEAITLARRELEAALSQGYPAYELNRNIFEYLRNKASLGWGEAHDAMEDTGSALRAKLDSGMEMDPEWIEVLDYTNYETTRLPQAIENAIALGRPIHADILKRYDEVLTAAQKKKPTVDYVKESLAKVVASKEPLVWTDGNGKPVDHTAALKLLFRDDRAAAVTVLQDILNQNLALNVPLDATAMAFLSQWDFPAALAIAQEQLQKDLQRNKPLDGASFSMLESTDAAAAATVLEQKIRDAITRGASDTTQIIGGTPPVTLQGAINKLADLDPGAKQRMAVLYLEDMIVRNGPLGSIEPELLTYLKLTNLSAYAGILVKSIRASNARLEYHAHMDVLKGINAPAAATLMQELLQLILARNGRVDVGGPPTYDVLNRLAALDKRAAEQFAKAALADALNRGIRISTSLAAPLPTAPATDTGNFTLTLQALNNWNPAAAADWAASFDMLADDKPMADIKAAFTPDQKASMQSWTTVMQKLLGETGMVDDTVVTQNNLDLDLETALQLVFMGRAQQLEKQLRDQITSVQAKNDLMGRMNDALGMLNKVQELVVSDAKATELLKDKTGGKLTPALITEVTNSLKAAGITPFTAGFSGNITKGELAGAIQQLKAQIDSLGNNQQTEMIRLQSLTTKRNECYEIITNQMQKMASINEKVLSNMR